VSPTALASPILGTNKAIFRTADIGFAPRHYNAVRELGVGPEVLESLGLIRAYLETILGAARDHR
jgi:hypothetical protein